jgi:hypothetical protein
MERKAATPFSRIGWRVALAAGTLLLLALSVRAQDRPPFAPIRTPPDGEPWRIERIEDIPPQLLSAIKRTYCRLDDSIFHEFPIQIFRPAGSKPMAIVPCGAIIYYSYAFLFDRNIRDEPSLMMFPVMAFPDGFSASANPGLITWDPKAETLVAFRGHDVGCQPVWRHTYRHGRGELNGFALVKVERGRLHCGNDMDNQWQVLWEASPWNVPP